MQARRLVLVTVLALLGVAEPARAQSVSVDCERLDRKARDELRARMRLAVRSAGSGSPFRVRLECTEHDATLVWVAAFEERITVDESAGLVEGTLDAIELRLRQSRRRSPARAQNVERPPPAPVPAPEARPRRGGVGLGLALELAPASVGPRLDFGIPLGPLTLLAMQSLRAAPEDTLLIGGEGGIGWGAPYDSRWPIGAALAIGVEALSASSSRGGPSAPSWSYTTYGSFGLRAAAYWQRVSVFVGVDLRRRFEPLMTQEPDVRPADTAVLFSLGTVLGLDLGERRRGRAVTPP